MEAVATKVCLHVSPRFWRDAESCIETNDTTVAFVPWDCSEGRRDVANGARDVPPLLLLHGNK